MNATLLKAPVALVPTCVLVAWSLIQVSRRKTASAYVRLLGAGCLMVVVLTHVCEALRLFPWMHWGESHGVGHYLDLSSAVLGVTLLVAGYVFEIGGKGHG